MHKFDKDGALAMLTDDYFNTFKRQIGNFKEQLDLKSTQLNAMHEKQGELRAYARELKDRAETLYNDKAEAMPPQLINAPTSLKETNDLQKSQVVHQENELLLLQGQLEQALAEVSMLKNLMRKGGQLKENDQVQLAQDKVKALQEQVGVQNARIKELEAILEKTDNEKAKLET